MVYTPRAQSGAAMAIPSEVPRKSEMTDDMLQAVIRNEIRNSVAYMGDEVTEDRRRALEYYYGEPFGGEQEGRSQVISMDVQDTIQGMMPDFMEIFAGGDQSVAFEPTGQEDEDAADQATEYVNHIWWKDNDGFSNTYDWVFDSLLQKNGICKIWWDKTERKRKQTLENVNALQLSELMQDEQVEILESNEAESDEEQAEPLWDIKLERTIQNGRVSVEIIPPEEFLISQRSTAIDTIKGIPISPFCAHRVKKTISQLIEEGFDPETVAALPSHDEQTANEERQTRFDVDETYPEVDDALDPAMREIWVYECYIQTDYDGDGKAELRQCTVAGPGYEILVNEEVEEYPFVGMTPLRIPHKFFGRAVAELVMDVQLIKSTLQRQFLDNIYFINNQRYALNDRVDLDSWLNQKPGAGVLVEGSEPVQGAIEPIVPVPLGQVIIPALSYWDEVMMARTGYTKYSQGLDADSLNKTATGIAQILSRAQMRMLLVARLFAENGFARAHSKILRLVHRHQDRERMIRLRGEWVPIDPRPWNADMDLTINVGLGHGTKQERAGSMAQLMSIQKEIIAAQGGPGGPIVDWKRLYNGLKQMTTSLGLKSADPYFIDPESPEGKQKIEEAKERASKQQPDPTLIKAQMEQQTKGQELELKGQEAQANAAETDAKMQLEAGKMQAEYSLKERELREKYDLEWAKLQVDAAKSELDVDAKNREINIKEAELEVKRDDVMIRADSDRERAEIDRDKTDREYEDRDKSREHEGKNRDADRKAAPKESKSESKAPTINVTVGGSKKTVKVNRDKDGVLTDATVDE